MVGPTILNLVRKYTDMQVDTKINTVLTCLLKLLGHFFVENFKAITIYCIYLI